MRYHALDWLRVLLFAWLVMHHSLVGFAPFGADVYGFANDRLGGDGVALLVYWGHTWRLPTLFLIAGIATWHASGKSGVARFVPRRLARLLVPLIFGALVLNPWAGLAITRMTGEGRDLLSFPHDWWLPVVPGQVMHLWFLGNLAFYTLLAAPLFMARPWLDRRLPDARTLLIGSVIATTLVAVIAKPFGWAIAGDGYQLYWYGGIFAAGYLLGARTPGVLAWTSRHAFWLIAVGIALFAAEVTLLDMALGRSDELGAAMASGGWAADALAPAYGPLGVGFATVEGLGAWAWAVAAMGLCGRYLDRDGPLLRALSPAIFPVYVLHFPVTIIGLALLTAVPWPWGWELLLLAIATYVLPWLGYLAFRLAGPAVWLVGGRRAAKKGPAWQPTP